MMQGPRVCIPSSLIFLPPVPVPTPAPHHPSPWSSFCPLSVSLLGSGQVGSRTLHLETLVPTSSIPW
jgi:hypothetical protein